jgi:hypothetical protein
MKRLITICLAVIMMLAASGVAQAETVNFTKCDIVSVIGDLSDITNQWGLWAVRARPIVSGSYTITGASTSQTGWSTSAPSWYSWSTYGTNCAWFSDDGGAEVAGTAANPLYMIMDVSEDNWWSSGFDKNGSWVTDWAPGPDGLQGTGDDLGTFYASGYDNGAGGTNIITAVNSSATFSFDFTVDSGTWNGQWEFLVDGSKYTLGTASSPGYWVENFFGDYGTGGDLSGNMGDGYTVPEPATICLLGLGVLSLLKKRGA